MLWLPWDYYHPPCRSQILLLLSQRIEYNNPILLFVSQAAAQAEPILPSAGSPPFCKRERLPGKTWKTPAGFFKQAGHTRRRLYSLWGRGFLFCSRQSTLPTGFLSQHYNDRKLLIILILLQSIKSLCTTAHSSSFHFCLFFLKHRAQVWTWVHICNMLSFCGLIWKNLQTIENNLCIFSLFQTFGKGRKENQDGEGVFPIISSFLSLTCHMETSPKRERCVH